MKFDREQGDPLCLVWHLGTRCRHAPNQLAGGATSLQPTCLIEISSTDASCAREERGKYVRCCLWTDLSAFLTVLHNGGHSATCLASAVGHKHTLLRGIEARCTFCNQLRGQAWRLHDPRVSSIIFAGSEGNFGPHSTVQRPGAHHAASFFHRHVGNRCTQLYLPPLHVPDRTSTHQCRNRNFSHCG